MTGLQTTTTAVGSPAATTAPHDASVAPVLSAIAWPIVAVAALVLLARPLGEFLRGIASRVTKLSAFNVELELAHRATPAVGIALEEIRRPGAAMVGDSGRALYSAVQDRTSADFATIDLGVGDEWLTSRLFIASLLLPRMRKVRIFVFVERRQEITQRFLALIEPQALRWRLAVRYPWLEASFVRAYAIAMSDYPDADPPPVTLPVPTTLPKHRQLVVDATGALEPTAAQRLVQHFIAGLQQPAAPATSDEWTPLVSNVSERASWVTADLVRELVPEHEPFQWIEERPEDDEAKRIATILRLSGDFAAIVDPDRRFTRLVDRRGVLEAAGKRFQT
jgi:hypothetical protein